MTTATKPAPTRTPAIAIDDLHYGRGFTGLTLDGILYLAEEGYDTYTFLRQEGRQSRSTVKVRAGKPVACTCYNDVNTRPVGGCKHRKAAAELLRRW